MTAPQEHELDEDERIEALEEATEALAARLARVEMALLVAAGALQSGADAESD